MNSKSILHLCLSSSGSWLSPVFGELEFICLGLGVACVVCVCVYMCANWKLLYVYNNLSINRTLITTWWAKYDNWCFRFCWPVGAFILAYKDKRWMTYMFFWGVFICVIHCMSMYLIAVFRGLYNWLATVNSPRHSDRACWWILQSDIFGSL